MMHFIGTDEAGYGPNLGPLVVSATCWSWQSPDSSAHILHQPHKIPTPRVVGQQPFLFADSDCDPTVFLSMTQSKKSLKGHSLNTLQAADALEELVGSFGTCVQESLASLAALKIGDSKKIYRKEHLSSLEFPVLVTLLASQSVQAHAISEQDFSWPQLVNRLGDIAPAPFWEVDFAPGLPLDAATGTPAELRHTAQMLARLWSPATGLILRSINSRRVYPREFNQMLSRGLKSDLLAEVTLGLAANAVHKIDTSATTDAHDTIVLLCDKLGGRNSYRDYLEHFFPDRTLTIMTESRPLSCYQLLGPRTTLFVRFQVHGESQPPTALASMVSKYVREVSMTAFNQYWQSKVPKLAPTAGYPLDARRFMAEIDPVRKKLAMDDASIWRNK
ncbi:MAG: hypothetical protein Q4G68_00595 [Planctomycetia bacterium]|nr:hypothetical protein [Planctomycetia bacterium]